VLEREAKLDAPSDFAVPDLTGAVEGLRVAPVEEKVLDATYYDTEDLRLIRFGITLRYRDTWTVKLPDRGPVSSGVMARDEIDIEGDPTVIPTLARSLVTGAARTAPLVPVARLVTRRRRHRLLGADGEALGEIDDDDVTVLDQQGNTVDRFREIEAEIVPEAPDALLPAVVERLLAAGATPGSSLPKVARALGPRASEPPDVGAP
jgi:inorganic triphosphatase YgiF